MPRIEVNVFQAEATATTIGPPQRERTLQVRFVSGTPCVGGDSGEVTSWGLVQAKEFGVYSKCSQKPQAFQWGMVEVTQEIHVFKDCTGLIYGNKLVESNSRSKETRKTTAITQATDDGSLDLRGSRGLERHESSRSLFGGSWQLVSVADSWFWLATWQLQIQAIGSKATAGPPSHEGKWRLMERMLTGLIRSKSTFPFVLWIISQLHCGSCKCLTVSRG